MISVTKFKRLNNRLQVFIKALDRTRSLALHQEINQFYYMQKAEELKIMTENLETSRVAFERAVLSLEANYREVFCRWQKDVRKLSMHERT